MVGPGKGYLGKDSYCRTCLHPVSPPHHLTHLSLVSPGGVRRLAKPLRFYGR